MADYHRDRFCYPCNIHHVGPCNLKEMLDDALKMPPILGEIPYISPHERVAFIGQEIPLKLLADLADVTGDGEELIPSNVRRVDFAGPRHINGLQAAIEAAIDERREVLTKAEAIGTLESVIFNLHNEPNS